jgi:hypothetical protein
MIRASWLEARAAGKENVEKEGQVAVFAHPSLVRDRPEVACSDRELEYERVLGHLDFGAWRISRRWKNLNSGTLATPRSRHTKATEAVFAAYPERTRQDGVLDLVADPLPLGRVERRTLIYGDNLPAEKRESDAARRSRKRKIKLVSVVGAVVILAWSSYALVEKQPQVG